MEPKEGVRGIRISCIYIFTLYTVGINLIFSLFLFYCFAYSFQTSEFHQIYDFTPQFGLFHPPSTISQVYVKHLAADPRFPSHIPARLKQFVSMLPQQN